MSFAARLRLSSVTIVPLLSPPFRVSLRPLRWLHHRLPSSVSLSTPQCRALHLYKTARAKTLLGMHKVIPFSRYYPPRLHESEHRINLLDGPGGKVIAKNVSLEEVYNDWVKPGHILYLCDKMPRGLDRIEETKKQETADEFNNYALLKAHSTNAHVRLDEPMYTKSDKTEIKQLAELKEVHLLGGSPVAHWQQMLDKAYRFIEAACPVEFSIKMKGKHIPKEEQLTPGPSDRWPWIHNHFPHLRPDFILKAMPEGTEYLINPFCDGRRVMWVLALPTQQASKNLTKRLLKVRRAVAKSIRQGKQGELPMVLRMGLIKSGNEKYSLDSGRAQGAAEERFCRGDDNIRWGSDSMDAISEFRREKLTNLNYSLGAGAEDPENRYMEPVKK